MSEPTKCNGCGKETKSDTGWCLSCRSILYTDLLIAESDFSRSEFKTMVFPVRDIIWMQDRIRLREAELKAADDTNDMMSAELARLRAELEKARAELATLDISYKEAIHSIGVDRHNAERWQSECLNAREEARRLQALIERRRIEANDTRVNAAGWEERALRAERERDEARAEVERGNRLNAQELERDLAKMAEIRARIHAASPSDDLDQLRKEIDGGYELFLRAHRNHIELVAENNKLFNSRETIDRLVIAFRVCLRWVAWNTKTVADIRRLIKAERGQAGKE